MSDHNQAFGGAPSTAVAEPGQDETLPVSNRPKPIVFIVAGAVLLVLAAAAYFLVFSGGGTSTDTGAVAPSKARLAAGPSKAAAVPSKAPAAKVAGAAVGSGIDPFRAPPVASASASASASPSASPSTTATSGGTSTAGVTSTLLVNSVDFTANTANVTVDGKTMVVKAGTIFAKYYTLRVVVTGSAQCGVFAFGDLPAQICKGQKATFTG
jgi:hypothetical protein